MSPTGPDENGAVTAVATADGVRITNNGNTALAFAALDHHALVQFAPCVDQTSACLRLRPRSTVLVPYADVTVYMPSTTEVVVYWWQVVADAAGGLRVDDMQSVVVPIRR